MRERLDAAIYRRALAELRERHREEFEEIRHGMLEEVGFYRDRDRVEEEKQLLVNYVQNYTDQTGEPAELVAAARHLGMPLYTARRLARALEEDGTVTLGQIAAPDGGRPRLTAAPEL